MSSPQEGRKFSLRRMEETDLVQVLELERAAYPSPWSERVFLAEIRGADTSYPLVAVPQTATKLEEMEEPIAGFVCCWIVRDLMQINNLAVSEEFRRLGLGRELLSAVLEKGRNKGVTSCYLDVRASNNPARTLYLSFGFYEIGLRKGYYLDTKEDAISMRLDFSTGGSHSKISS